MGVTASIDITPQQRKTILDLLKTYLPNTQTWVYGSRAKWTAKPHSDLDMVVFATPEQSPKVSALKEAFEESDLPFRVDLFVWDEVPEQFRKNIQSDHVVLQEEEAQVVPGGWREMPFTEAVHVNPRVPLKRGVLYPFVDMKAINVSWRGAEESERREFKSGGAKFISRDTLMARITPCLENGKIARYMPQNSAEITAFGSTEFIVIRGRDGVTDNDFAYYLTKWESFRRFAISQMTGSSGRQRVPSESLSEFSAPVPPLSEQKDIAHILGTLDDKIELNRKMNATLEGMAQALFKSWFVDFDPMIDNALAAGNPIPEELATKAEKRKAMLSDGKTTAYAEALAKAGFPDSFQPSELGPIPEGWNIRSLSDLFDLIGGGTPKTSKPEYWNGDIPWFSVVDAPADCDVFVIDTEKHIAKLGLENSSTKVLPVGTTIISARGTVGKCALVGQPMAMNQSCYGVRGKENIADNFVYFTVRNQVADLQRGGHGSVFNTITRNTFSSIRIPFNDETLTIEFQKTVSPWLDKILNNLHETNTLAALRDTLLPKLLSGELRVEEAEKMVRDVT